MPPSLRLSERQRMALMLSRFENMSYVEIAETMDLSTKAVKSLLSRARVNLKDILQPYIDAGVIPAEVVKGNAANEPENEERGGMMSTAKLSDDTPLDPDDELLVAYLDHELDRKEQSELENRLMEDEPLRARLQQLQTGWDLLDDLPKPEPSLKLVESTLELVVADIVKTQASFGLDLEPIPTADFGGCVFAWWGSLRPMESPQYRRPVLISSSCRTWRLSKTWMLTTTAAT